MFLHPPHDWVYIEFGLEIHKSDVCFLAVLIPNMECPLLVSDRNKCFDNLSHLTLIINFWSRIYFYLLLNMEKVRLTGKSDLPGFWTSVLTSRSVFSVEFSSLPYNKLVLWCSHVSQYYVSKQAEVFDNVTQSRLLISENIKYSITFFFTDYLLNILATFFLVASKSSCFKFFKRKISKITFFSAQIISSFKLNACISQLERSRSGIGFKGQVPVLFCFFQNSGSLRKINPRYLGYCFLGFNSKVSLL